MGKKDKGKPSGQGDDRGASQGRKDKFDLGPFLTEVRDWALWLSFAVILSFVVGNLLNFFLATQTPLVAIMSGSMEHDSTAEKVHYSYLQSVGFSRDAIDAFPLKGGFRKGDVLVVRGGEKEYKVGQVLVFNAPGANYPIIHRIIGTAKDSSGKIYYRTKGDHNPSEDRWLIPHSEARGQAVFVIPLLGYVKVVPMELCTAVGACQKLYG